MTSSSSSVSLSNHMSPTPSSQVSSIICLHHHYLKCLQSYVFIIIIKCLQSYVSNTIISSAFNLMSPSPLSQVSSILCLHHHHQVSSIICVQHHLNHMSSSPLSQVSSIICLHHQDHHQVSSISCHHYSSFILCSIFKTVGNHSYTWKSYEKLPPPPQN